MLSFLAALIAAPVIYLLGVPFIQKVTDIVPTASAFVLGMICLWGVASLLVIWNQHGKLKEWAKRMDSHAHVLEQEKQKFQSLFDHHPDLICIANREGMIVEINPGKEHLVGDSPELTFGTPFLQYIVPEDQQRIASYFQRVLEGEALSYETAILNLVGERVEFAVKAVPLFKGQKVEGVYFILKEITAEKQLQAELTEKHDKMTTLLQSTPVGIAEVDMAGRIQVWNRGAERIFGWKQEELQGRYAPNVPREEFLSFRDQLMQGKELVGKEVRRRKKDGSPLDINLTMSKINTANGEVAGFIVILEDITLRKREERKRQHDLEMARKIQESVLSPPIEDGSISIHSTYIPSYKVSGDMYCWYQIDQHRYGVMMLDVMGHGVSSCLISMSIRSLLRGMIVRVQKPELVFAELNKHMNGLFQSQIGIPCFFTATYLLIDRNEQSIEYINAGNPPGFLHDEDGLIRLLSSSSPPIGLSVENQVKAEKLHFSGNARIMLYSDGLLGKGSLKQGVDELLQRFFQHRHLDPYPFSRMMGGDDDQDDICVVVADIVGDRKDFVTNEWRTIDAR